MKYISLVILLMISCASPYHNHLSIKSINTTLKDGKWIIDEPLLEKIDVSVESIIIENYRNELISRFDNIKYISDIKGISTLNKALEKTIKTLDLYKSKTNFDYLVSTKLEIINCKNPLKKILSIKLIAYDLNTKSKIFENEYHSVKNIKDLKSSKFKKFVDKSMNEVISDFTKKNNWKMIQKI